MAQRSSAKQQRICHCGRTFSKAEHLARHQRSHTKEKPFRCIKCDRAYSRQDSLQRHLRTHPGVAGLPLGRTGTAHEETSPTGPVLGIGNDVHVTRNRQGTFNGNSNNNNHSSSNINSNANPNGVGEDAATTTLHERAALPGNLDDFASTIGSVLADTSHGLSSTGLTGELTGWDFLTSQSDHSWLLSSDFDVHALDHSVTSAIATWGRPNYDPAALHNAMHTDAALILQHMNTDSDVRVPPGAAVAVQQKWYTHVTPPASSSASAWPAHPHQQDQIDEAYRYSLTSHLYYQMSDDALPSADFLNLCINLYFSKFHPIFPIVHAPSFRPSTENALILLSICSMGALLMGSAAGAAQGRKIFQRLNKAILATWERRISRGREEVLSLAQASVIGQTVGMMSGYPTDLYLAESFHGTVISWARRAGMFQLTDTHPSLSVTDADAIGEAWGSWAHVEASARIVLALHIHDALFSSIFHHEPLLRHDAQRLPRCCSEDLFSAPTAETWCRLIGSSSSEAAVQPVQLQVSRFRAYVILAGILATINDARHSSLVHERSRELQALLVTWRKEYINMKQSPSDDPQGLLVLWHEACMSVHVDLDVLERFIGRDGPAIAEQQDIAVHQWVASAEAGMCVTHAILIKNYLEAVPTGREPALHIPRALFFAGIVIYAFIKARPKGTGFTIPQFHPCMSVENCESGGGVVTPTLQPGAPEFSKIDVGVICGIVDLLQRQGHWNLSRKLASILELLLNDSVHGSVGAP